MAFASGIAPNAHVLLDQIRLFAVAQCGYTQLMWQPDGSNQRLHLQHAASAQFVHLRSHGTQAVDFYGSTAWNAALGYAAQTVASRSIHTSWPAGNIEYFLFGANGYCTCILPTAAHSFTGISFGTLVKTSAFVGGAYLGTTGPGIVRADYDGRVDAWNLRPDWANNFSFSAIDMSSPISFSPLPFNGVTAMFPLIYQVSRATPASTWSVLGLAPGLRQLRLAGQYNSRDIITLGAHEWMVFAASSSPHTTFAYLR